MLIFLEKIMKRFHFLSYLFNSFARFTIKFLIYFSENNLSAITPRMPKERNTIKEIDLEYCKLIDHTRLKSYKKVKSNMIGIS